MRKGDIFELRLPKGSGHEQRGRRFGVLLQADEFLPRSVVLIAPTSRSARPASFRPEIEVNEDATKVLVEQVGAIDVGRLGKLVGHVGPEEEWEIEVNEDATKVLVEQVGAIDVGRLGKLVGHVGPEEEWEIDDALRLVLGLR